MSDRLGVIPLRPNPRQKKRKPAKKAARVSPWSRDWVIRATILRPRGNNFETRWWNGDSLTNGQQNAARYKTEAGAARVRQKDVKAYVRQHRQYQHCGVLLDVMPR